MRYLCATLIVFLAGFLAGCSVFGHHSQAAQATTPTAAIVTPDTSSAGTVVAVNAVGRFVVLNFPGAQMPNIDRSFYLYHSGLKVAEVKITGPQNNNNIVADLITGDAEVGDSVRAE